MLGGFYKGAGQGRRPTAVLVHGLPGIEKNLDIAYRLRDLGWNCLYFHFRGSWGSEGEYSLAGLVEDTQAAVEWALPAAVNGREPCRSHRREHRGVRGASLWRHRCARSRNRRDLPSDLSRATSCFATTWRGSSPMMLNAISPRELQRQWEAMAPRSDVLPQLTSRPLLLVTGDRDDLFPPSHYAAFTATLPHVRWSRARTAITRSARAARGWCRA